MIWVGERQQRHCGWFRRELSFRSGDLKLMFFWHCRLLEFGFAEDDVLLVDGGSFTVWKVGTKTVVMTIFCWASWRKTWKKQDKPNHETVPLNPCRRWWWCCGGQPREPGATKTGKTWWRLQTGCNRFSSVEAFHLQLSIFSKIVPVSSLASEPPVNPVLSSFSLWFSRRPRSLQLGYRQSSHQGLELPRRETPHDMCIWRVLVSLPVQIDSENQVPHQNIGKPTDEFC